MGFDGQPFLRSFDVNFGQIYKPWYYDYSTIQTEILTKMVQGRGISLNAYHMSSSMQEIELSCLSTSRPNIEHS